MDLSKHIDKDNLHHAYLIEGDPRRVVPQVFSFLEEMGVETKGNPDLWQREFETFGIDDARELKEMQIQKAIMVSDRSGQRLPESTDPPNGGEWASGSQGASTPGVKGPQKFFIISANSFTTEAQNALLKVFEEPAPGVHFFIITPSASRLLPTLHSRLEHFDLRRDSTPGVDRSAKWRRGSLRESNQRAAEFLKSPKDKRLEFVKELSEEKAEALSFLDDLECCLQKKTNPARLRCGADYKCFEEIWRCRNYMNQRGASIKMLLEHLALVLPY